MAKILNADGASPLRQRKSNAVYHTVRRAILLGELAADEAILEQQVAGIMGCSQGTVREALLRLEQDGLVVRRGYRGTLVSRTTFDEATHMVRVRLALESASARRAAAITGDADLAALDDIITRIAAAESARDGYAVSECDRAFHMAIFRIADLPMLEPILTRCALHIHRFTFAQGRHKATPDNRVGLPSSADQHRDLRNALATRDAETAARAMHDHIEIVLGYWSPDLLHAVRALPPAAL